MSLTLAAAAATLAAAPRAASACTPTPNYLCDINSTGTILTSPTIYLVYWGWPAGCSTTSCPSDTKNMIPILEENLRPSTWLTTQAFGTPGTRWWNVLTQYNGDVWGGSGGPSYFSNNSNIVPASSWFDTSHPYVEYGAPNGLQAIQDEVNAAIVHFQNQGYTFDGNSLVIIARPPGSTGYQGACAYHGQLQPQRCTCGYSAGQARLRSAIGAPQATAAAAGGS
jgi:hypothetical protein